MKVLNSKLRSSSVESTNLETIKQWKYDLEIQQ
jgi:hypothetical protein